MFLQKLGLLALLNEESHFPKATDDTLLEKLHSQHSVGLSLYDRVTAGLRIIWILHTIILFPKCYLNYFKSGHFLGFQLYKNFTLY